jgi:hypothetical protein
VPISNVPVRAHARRPLMTLARPSAVFTIGSIPNHGLPLKFTGLRLDQFLNARFEWTLFLPPILTFFRSGGESSVDGKYRCHAPFLVLFLRPCVNIGRIHGAERNLLFAHMSVEISMAGVDRESKQPLSR